jgi:large subunit ribosomal protein L10
VNLLGQLEAKKQIVADLKDKFTNAQSIVVVDYTGVNAKQTTNLRKSLREAGVDYIVTKNTLFKRAAEESGYGELADVFTGVTAVAFCAEDVIAPANIICKFIKDEKVMTIKGGAAEGKVVDVDQINVLGTLPGRETLLAQVAMCFKAPLQKVCFALEEIRKKAEAEGQATA